MDGVFFDAYFRYLSQRGQVGLTCRKDISFMRICGCEDSWRAFWNKTISILALTRLWLFFKDLYWRHIFKACDSPLIVVKMRLCLRLLHFFIKHFSLSISHACLAWAKSTNPILSAVETCRKYFHDLLFICKLAVQLLSNCQIIRYLTSIHFASNRFSCFYSTLNLMGPFFRVKIVFLKSSLLACLCHGLMKVVSLVSQLPDRLRSRAEVKNLWLFRIVWRELLCVCGRWREHHVWSCSFNHNCHWIPCSICGRFELWLNSIVVWSSHNVLD